VVPDGLKPEPRKMPTASADLVPLLADGNGWVRDTAQRVLVERKDMSVAPAVNELAKSGSTLAKIHALWTLEGMGALTPEAVGAALKDSEAKVRVTGIRLADQKQAAELAKLIDDPSPEVHTMLALIISAWPEQQETLLTLMRKHGADPLVRDAALSGLRGRELEVLEALLTGKQELSKDESAICAALAQAVMTERRSARVKSLIQLITKLPANSPLQQTLLAGAGAKKAGAKPKLLYLDEAVPELAQLATTADAKTKPLLAAVDARVAWAGKPGVPPPPVIRPLNAEEQKLYETGKVVYHTLCAACHQPTGTGMAGLAPPLIDSDWVLGEGQILPRIVLNGLSGPVKVNGQAWSLEMPPLGAALSDEQIAGVLTYIRREWEHGADPIPLKTVTDLRAQYKDRTTAWSGEEIGELRKELKKGAKKDKDSKQANAKAVK
jgi:mono/diheme cytochrome c family protein